MNPIVWNVGPEIVQLGPFTLRWYGLLFALGFFLGFFLMRWMFRREGKPEQDLDPLLVYMLVGTIVGARLGHVLFYEPAYYLSQPWLILQVWKGGLASHGGTLGILIALYLYARKRPKQPYLWLLDRMAVPTALGATFIRLGNLFNSEILGIPTDKPWAFVFERAGSLLPADRLVPRHPAMLYESLSYFAIFWLLLWVYRKYGAKTPHGLLLGLFLVLVFTARFFIEFVKLHQADFTTDLPLRMGQMLSIPFVVGGLALLVRAGRTRPPAADPA